ncbi:MAG: transglutaminase domain-containing protein [Nitrospirae bacterium]|nr:transglutaminase domain-containing protein [Nitrospirota bacterium]
MIAGSPRQYRQHVRWLLVFPFLLPLLLSGCAGLYFREVGAPPQPPPRHALRAWPSHEYWTGIIFNGEKIGLTHLALIPAGEPGSRFELRSEALLAFHFLGFSKSVTLKAQDWVTDQLRLERFAHEYDLDGQKLKLSGKVERGQLQVERETGGRTSHETIPVPLGEAVYPTSAIVLYPTLHGLAVGRKYTYLVYDGQRQQLARVSQTIEAYQESDLFEGLAFQVETSLDGQRSTTWINERGDPVLEMAWHGVLISTLESEKRAKAYLARASLNKREVLLEYSRVRTNTALPRPRVVTTMQVAVQGLPDTFALPSDYLQQCGRQESQIDGQSGGRIQCLIHAADPSKLPAEPSSKNQKPGAQETELAPYLKPTKAIQSEDPEIQKAAKDIVGGTTEPIPQIRRLIEWLQQNVTQKPVDVFSALDVLERRKAECQGLTWLYAAFARSLDIPTRVTNGLVYSRELEGFLYHTWAESYVGSGWLPVDPTFGQVGVDATHLKLLDGDRLADLLPLVDLVGKIRVEILSFSPAS